MLCQMLRPDPQSKFLKEELKSEKEQMEQDTCVWNFNFIIYFE